MKKKNGAGYPYAISIIRHQLYNREIAVDNDHIQILELMLGLANVFEQKGRLQFFHTLENISIETGLKLYTVRKAIKHWKELGVLNIEKKGEHNNNYFSINYFVLLKLLPKLYRKFKNYEPDEVRTRAFRDIGRRIKRRKQLLNRGAVNL